MGFNVNNLNELEILVGVTDNATKEFKRIKDTIVKDTKEVTKETENLGKTSKKTSKGMVDGIKDQIKPMNNLLLTTARLGIIFGVTFGSIIKAIKDTGKEITNLDKLSIKLGVSASELSMKFHGFDITTQHARIGVASMENTFYTFGNALTFAKLGITETIAETDILNRQFGVTSRLITAMTGIRINVDQKMSREDAIGQIKSENIKARQASPEGQAMQMAEVKMAQQLSMSKVELKRLEFEQTLALMQQYGTDTIAYENAFAQTEMQDKLMLKMQLNAEMATLDGDYTRSANLEKEMQMLAFRKLTNDESLIKTKAANLDIQLTNKKRAARFQENQMMISGLEGLGGALNAYAAQNKNAAKTAQGVSMAMAIVNTAQGVSAALAGPPTGPVWPLNIAMAAMVAATGALQIATISGQSFATGGRPPVGQASLVGERGTELFVPDSAGTIIPNNRLGGQKTQYINIEINNPVVNNREDIGALAEEVSTILAREAERL